MGNLAMHGTSRHHHHLCCYPSHLVMGIVLHCGYYISSITPYPTPHHNNNSELHKCTRAQAALRNAHSCGAKCLRKVGLSFRAAFVPPVPTFHIPAITRFAAPEEAVVPEAWRPGGLLLTAQTKRETFLNVVLPRQR